ncbi:hypothetical protein PsorP6_009288 [Peronosclerospora sorghi]|uniref:Uncharacterized protein n=1 Tax=Peronosclerospora sorghi TaxID=230839 RepID=A0ACC0VZA6_9STRA|nr:hypothetical protein PsorP6_009288 [Peronosclerospora sorghi]
MRHRLVRYGVRYTTLLLLLTSDLPVQSASKVSMIQHHVKESESYPTRRISSAETARDGRSPIIMGQAPAGTSSSGCENRVGDENVIQLHQLEDCSESGGVHTKAVAGASEKVDSAWGSVQLNRHHGWKGDRVNYRSTEASATAAAASADPGCMGISIGSDLAEQESTDDGVRWEMGERGTSMVANGIDTTLRSNSRDISTETGVLIKSRDVSVESGDVDVTAGSHKTHRGVSDEAYLATDFAGFQGTLSTDVSATSQSPSKADVIFNDTPHSSHDTKTTVFGTNHATKSLEKGLDVQAVGGLTNEGAYGMSTASSGYAGERSVVVDELSRNALNSNESVSTGEGMLLPRVPNNLTVSTNKSAALRKKMPLANFTDSRSFNGMGKTIKVFSHTAMNSSLSNKEAGDKSSLIISEDYVPYVSTYCRCDASECQNMYLGNSSGPRCQKKLQDDLCPPGYKTCVSTDSYKVSMSTVTPFSVAEATFTLLAADIVGAFYNLGPEDPMTRNGSWWITVSLPSGWRFVAWENTAVEVRFWNNNYESRSILRVHGCADITKSKNCDRETHRYGFVNVMGLLEGQKDLMTLSSGGPMTFVLSNSIITGTCASTSGSSSVGLSISLSYESSSGTLKSAAASRRTRKLMGLSSDSTTPAQDLSALTLAMMAVPSVKSGRLDSSLLWMEQDTEIMTLSFSTTTIISPNLDNPKVCVNLRSTYCASKGSEPNSTVTFGSFSVASYVQGGNPFINLYADPGETMLSIQSDNATYFCITGLLPSGVIINRSWEIRKSFTFQIQVSNVAWTGDEMSDSSNSFHLPRLAEVILMDNNAVLGSDCAQTLVHAKTYSKYTLSVYSVMSITLYAVALAGAILVTRMNGITFSKPTFYNDMTSLSIMMGFVLCIVGNAIWIRVSTSVSSASGSSVYYSLYAMSICFMWTMMTSVCFHWGTVLFNDLGPSGHLLVFTTYVILNMLFYGIQLFGVMSFTSFYKCAYDDYLKNPFYSLRLCANDYCPDLQPVQWKYAVDNVCKDVGYSGLFFPLRHSADLLIFLTSVGLLVLGGFVIQRGVRLIDQSGHIFDDHVIKVMKKSLITYLVVILSIAIVLGTCCIMNAILYWKSWTINSVVWYIFSVWLPTLVPSVGFLVLQWNPRLHGMNQDPSLHVKDPHFLHHTMSIMSERVENGKLALTTNGTGLSDDWAGILHFPDTEYNPIGQESVDGAQNVLALAVQLVSSVPLTYACYVELYIAENTAPEAVDIDVNADDSYEDLPVLIYRRSSINMFIESGLHQEGILNRRSHSQSLLGSGTPLPTPVPSSTQAAKWSRVGFTETVLPTLVNTSSGDGTGAVTQVATFLSVLQIPLLPANPLLRFVVYEIPEKASSSPSSLGDIYDSHRLVRASSLQLDERARIARVSGMGMAPPSRPKVFCEFSCAVHDMLSADEVNLVARQVSHRSLSPIPSILSDATCLEVPTTAPATGVAVIPEVDPSIPRLRVKSMTVSPRQLKENSDFYITKSFQFAVGNEMVIEDMVESPLTNELPRQYLELLISERTDDLTHAQNEAADFDAKVMSGLVSNLYDSLIEQIQGENDRTMVQTWLHDRVQQRKMYVEALRECHQLCIDRAEEGLNFKASTEKKSLVLRFLPINLHVQDMWVGPTADLRSQHSRRTSPSVKVYPTVTVGAFAAHCFKFRNGESIISLRSTLQKRSLSRVLSDVSEKNGSDVDWSDADIRAADKARWNLTTRLDMCFSQALTTLIASFCRKLEHALQDPSNCSFLHTIDSIGFLFQVESLLSTHGKEIGMLEDFSAAVDALKHVAIVLDTSPPSHLPSTLLNLHMKNTTLPSVVSVRLSKGSTKGTFTVAVGVRCPETTRELIPPALRSGGSICVTPVIFTQGINEMQTLANNASTKKTTLQDIMNRKSFAVLTRYIEKYKQLALNKVRVIDNVKNKVVRFETTCASLLLQPDAVLTPMSTIEPLVKSLEERIATASKRHVVKSKHPKIIQESSRLCRLLGAGRVTSCKSAKDRTSMSVTLEQVRLLSENHGLPDEFAVRTVSTMRSNGVRLENALKNTGKRQYAFNTLQRSLLPDEYKCPEGTYGRGNVS